MAWSMRIAYVTGASQQIGKIDHIIFRQHSLICANTKHDLLGIPE